MYVYEHPPYPPLERDALALALALALLDGEAELEAEPEDEAEGEAEGEPVAPPPRDREVEGELDADTSGRVPVREVVGVSVIAALPLRLGEAEREPLLDEDTLADVEAPARLADTEPEPERLATAGNAEVLVPVEALVPGLVMNTHTFVQALEAEAVAEGVGKVEPEAAAPEGEAERDCVTGDAARERDTEPLPVRDADTLPLAL